MSKVFLFLVCGCYIWFAYEVTFIIIKKVFLAMFGNNYVITIKYKYRSNYDMREHVEKKYVKAMSQRDAYSKFIGNMLMFEDINIISYTVEDVSSV